MRDHALSGRLKGIRECHLDDDVLLLYTHENDVVRMLVICSHDDIRGPRERAVSGALRRHRRRT